MVRMAGEDGGGAVDLLGHDDASEGVCQGELPQREQEAGTRARCITPSAGRADGEDDVLRSFVAAGAEPLCECLGVHLLAAAIEKNSHGRRAGLLFREPLEQSLLCSEGRAFAAGKGGGPLEVELHERLKLIASGRAASDMSKGDEHKARIKEPEAGSLC